MSFILQLVEIDDTTLVDFLEQLSFVSAQVIGDGYLSLLNGYIHIT